MFETYSGAATDIASGRTEYERQFSGLAWLKCPEPPVDLRLARGRSRSRPDVLGIGRNPVANGDVMGRGLRLVRHDETIIQLLPSCGCGGYASPKANDRGGRIDRLSR
jgi:hypothetical protein